MQVKRRPWGHLALISLGLGVVSSVLALELSLLRHTTHLPASSQLDSLYHVQLDHWRRRNEWDRDSRFIPDGEPPDQLTYTDAHALLSAPIGGRRAAFYEFSGAVSAGTRPAEEPIIGAATHSDFFGMMGARFFVGAAWTAANEAAAARVVVLSNPVNTMLFNGRDSVGQLVAIAGSQYRVVGVLAPWRPPIKFYSAAVYSPMNGLYIPQQTALAQRLSPSSRVVCSLKAATALPELADSECAWIQFWIELPGADVQQFEAFLLEYIASQKLIDRFPRAPNILLLSARDWTQRMANASGVFVGLIPAMTLTLLLALVTVNAMGNWFHWVTADPAHEGSDADRLRSARRLIAWLAPVVAVALGFAELAYLRRAAEARLQLQGWSLEAIAPYDWTLIGFSALVAAVMTMLSTCYATRQVSPVERLDPIQPKQVR